MKKLLVIALSFLSIGATFAAVNPTAPGASSSGSVGVSVEVGPLVQITQVKDITLTNWNGGAYADDPLLSQNFCVYSNISGGQGGKYDIQFNGNNGNRLLLTNQSNSNEIAAYELLFNNQRVTSGGITISGQQGSTNINCNGNTNVNLKIKLLGTANGKVLHAGTYTDQLNLTVTPAMT